jgi:GT2 family glycosyltransferase
VFGDQSVDNQAFPFCNNANCAIRKSLWDQIQYDEELTGLEDLDWGKKIQEKGFSISYRADAEIIHIHEESVRQILNRYRREAIALKKIFPGQRLSLLSFLRLFISNTVNDYFHALLDRKFFSNIFDIPLYRFLQFWGAYLGGQEDGVTATLKKTLYYPRNLKRSTLSGEHRSPREKIKYETA